MAQRNFCGGSAILGSKASLPDGKVGVLIRDRAGTADEFMSSSNVTPLIYAEYYYNENRIKSLLEEHHHVAFRNATFPEAKPYLQVMGHIENKSIQMMHPTGKQDRVSLTLHNPGLSRNAPKAYVRTPKQAGAKALRNLKGRLEDLGGEVGTVSIPDMYVLGYQESDRSNCIDPHDDHSSTDFDTRGMFRSYTCRYNCYTGMHSQLKITAMGVRIDENGKEQTKTFGHCSWPLNSDFGFYILDPTGQYSMI